MVILVIVLITSNYSNFLLSIKDATYSKIIYLVSIIFLQASANFESCFRASPVNRGFKILMGMSFMISLNITCETTPSASSHDGNIGSTPRRSCIFLSTNHLEHKVTRYRLQLTANRCNLYNTVHVQYLFIDSLGASIPSLD